ncbi:hypothetical protein [Actinomadura sp. 3N508]|uniref:hypothetical protein n=1 Tax=Actinomadura sp. 3N508 TaxID=3375153 RepID=UPI00379932E7
MVAEVAFAAEAEPGSGPVPLEAPEAASAVRPPSDAGPERTRGGALAQTPQDGGRAQTSEDEAWPTQDSDAGAEPVLGADLRKGPEGEEEPTPDAAETVRVLIGGQARLDVVRAVVRAAVYSLPIAARPIPVAGLLLSIFWLANAAALYEGTRRQAVHDRLIGTLVVKRPPTDSSAF